MEGAGPEESVRADRPLVPPEEHQNLGHVRLDDEEPGWHERSSEQGGDTGRHEQCASGLDARADGDHAKGDQDDLDDHERGARMGQSGMLSLFHEMSSI